MRGPILTVTGVDGFVGRHVARLAAERGLRVIGISRAETVPAEVARHLHAYHSADLRTTWPESATGDAIVHLAGLAAVGPSFERPQEYIASNSAIVTTMCESLVRQDVAARVIAVSTGAVYGPPAPHQPVTEHSPVAPSSPYVVSKLLVESQLEYYRTRGVDSITVRPFNHLGPGQGPGFILPDMVDAIRALGAANTLAVGNVLSSRDYTDVRDVARAYLELATAPQHAERVYNVASGRSHTGAEIIALIAHALGRPVPELIVDPARLRSNDPPHIVGSADRLIREFGWSPRYSLEESIRDFVGGIGD